MRLIFSRTLTFLCSGLCLLTILTARASDQWTDITTPLLERLTNNGAKPAWPGGFSGVIVNRANGDLTVKLVGLGLWRSSDQGKNWRRIDDDVISGRDETGWATTADQNNPTRMASFSLDGGAGWTTDATKWQPFTTLGRNWDYGSVDWSQPNPKTIIAAKHETTPPGEVYLTADAGLTWKQLPIHLDKDRHRISMIGALAAKILIYSNGDGIHRSIDTGATWTKISLAHPQTRIPTLFQGTHYLGTTNGLLTTKNLGETWQPQGSPINIWQGPYFGRDEKEMMITGANGLYITRDAGATWKHAASLKPKEGKQSGFEFTPNWFGCYAWDPINNVLYTSSMGNAVYRLTLPME